MKKRELFLRGSRNMMKSNRWTLEQRRGGGAAWSSHVAQIHAEVRVPSLARYSGLKDLAFVATAMEVAPEWL